MHALTNTNELREPEVKSENGHSIIAEESENNPGDEDVQIVFFPKGLPQPIQYTLNTLIKRGNDQISHIDIILFLFNTILNYTFFIF